MGHGGDIGQKGACAELVEVGGKRLFRDIGNHGFKRCQYLLPVALAEWHRTNGGRNDIGGKGMQKAGKGCLDGDCPSCSCQPDSDRVGPFRMGITQQAGEELSGRYPAIRLPGLSYGLDESSALGACKRRAES